MIHTQSIARKTRLLTGAASTALLFAAVPAFAQDQTQATAAAAQPEAAPQDIVVTGSRIARPDLQAAVPLAVVSAQAIRDTGATNIQDTLAQLPQVGQGISRTSSNFSNTGNGQATINLRNLGSSRTLVLIDGRRTLGIAGTSSVDVNNIPTELIDRVEVVTGGASAVYGSEAIAGVVNFVYKTKYDGISAHAQTTISDKGDAARQYASITAGQSFLGDRGHVMVNVGFDNDQGLPSRNRSFSAHDNPNRSSYAAQGLFSVDPNGRDFTTNGNTYTFDGANGLKGYQGANVDGYDRNQQRYLATPVRRYLATALANFTVSDALTIYGEGEYVKSQSNASLEALAVANSGPGAALSFDGTAYAGIPISSPYVPAAIRNAAIANGVNVIQFRRRSVDIFSRSNKNDRDFYRGVLGFKGEVLGGWKYDAYYEHSESTDHTSAGAIYAPNYGAALSNQLDAGGSVVCSNAAARAAGCVPINIFGFNTVTPAAAKFLQTYTGPTTTLALVDGPATVTNGQAVTYDYLAKVQQDVGSLSFSGNLFRLWGGPVAIAFGGEYRREKSSETYDPFTRAGLSSGNQITNTVGSFDVKEAFGEVVAPIIEDKPLIKYLGLEGAIRYADYSTVGGVTSWKAGGSYAPTSDIRFRGVYARATRAPNIGELFASVSQTFPSLTDPCDQGQGNGDGAKLVALPSGCSSIPGIAATVARNGSFAYSTSQIQTIDGLLGGNRNLKAEEANTLTAGAVFTPHFLRNFSLTADYYNIKVKNAIGIIGQQVSVSQCFQNNNPLFCNNVVRNAQGFITRVNALNLNTGSYLVSGLDIAGTYKTSLGAVGIPTWTLNADLSWNHRFKQQQTPFPGGPVQNEIGQADCYSCGRLGSGFSDRVYGSVTLAPTGAFSINYRFNYMSPLSDNLDGSTTVVTHIPAYWYHNAQVRFDISTPGTKQKMELYLGVNNLLDTRPPAFGDTNPVTWPGSQTVADTYDVFGRMIYAGATVRF